jgi:hypothetical protein
MEALQPPKACVFFGNGAVILDAGFFPAGTALKVFVVASSADFSSREVGISGAQLESPTIPGIGANAEMGALCVPAKVHIHPEKRAWKSSLSGCRRFLRDRLHLTSPFQSSVKQSF